MRRRLYGTLGTVRYHEHAEIKRLYIEDNNISKITFELNGSTKRMMERGLIECSAA